MVDLLSNTLSAIKNAEIKSKPELVTKPASKLLVKLMEILKKEKYIADFEHIKDNKGGSIKIKLNQSINNIGSIRPRFSVKLDDLEKFEKRYLPAKNFGRLILSTPKGVITNLEAKEKKIGGVLLAYVY